MKMISGKSAIYGKLLIQAIKSIGKSKIRVDNHKVAMKIDLKLMDEHYYLKITSFKRVTKRVSFERGKWERQILKC